MTPADRNYSALLLLWSRTLTEHKLGWEEWLVRRYRKQKAAA